MRWTKAGKMTTEIDVGIGIVEKFLFLLKGKYFWNMLAIEKDDYVNKIT